MSSGLDEVARRPAVDARERNDATAVEQSTDTDGGTAAAGRVGLGPAAGRSALIRRAADMGPQVYELRVRGPVPAELAREIGATDVVEEPALTILRTQPTDQSGLHGVLDRLRSLGLDLLEVRSSKADVPGLPSGEGHRS